MVSETLDFLFLLVYLYQPLFPLYLPLSLPLFPFLLYITPTVFRLVSLYELLLYLNFRIVLERVKQKGRMTNCSVLIRKIIKLFSVIFFLLCI